MQNMGCALRGPEVGHAPQKLQKTLQKKFMHFMHMAPKEFIFK